jgi:thiol-disulfide isomerase/thioredoxin
VRAIIVGAILCAIAVVGAMPAAAETGPVTLKGQVVCSDCWFEQKDRKATPYGSASELKCAVRCSKDDLPQALAVWTGDTATLYLLENGAFKKDGKDFLASAGKEVEITGTTRVADTKHYLKVDALAVVGAGPAAATAAPAPALGAQAPALALSDLSGQEQSLASYRGKIVVLNFWATWCVPCRKEMPAFVNLQTEYAAWGVQVVAASADTAETQGQVVKFVRDKKLSFPVWLGATTDHMLAFGLGSELPGTVIIDRDGNVVARYKGMIKEADLKKEIDALLAKQQAAAGGGPVAKAAKSSVPA